MSFGKMQEFIDIILPTTSTDSEGFSVNRDEILASIRGYKEERHGSTRWLNMASFSDATVLFKFRKIPDLESILTENNIFHPVEFLKKQ